MLIRVTQAVQQNANLAAWMAEVVEGDWQYALVFPGSEESVSYLTAQIMERSGDTEILTLRGVDLDDWRAARAQ
jgi:hypothetical protein